jgi:NADH-quinone oxidoreductase subunit F
MMQRYLFRNIEHPESADIQAYESVGGYRSLGKAVSMDPQAIIEEIKKSGLRGRGGAGFPTAMKLSFAAAEKNFPKYILCNADEGEPGTFKDRVLLERNPHLVIEGTVIAGLAAGAETGYVYLRAEYPRARETLKKAIPQAYEKGLLGENLLGSGRRFHLAVHQGAGAYICGEETALIESLEGKRGHPRVRPPFTVNKGYLGKPTVVNNVETLANIPIVLEIGAGAYSRIGTKGSPGPKLFSVSGHVERPGAYELPMGTPMKEIIYGHCGGVSGGRALKAVIPGGLSTPVLRPEKTDCAMDFITITEPECRSMLGSGAVIVFDETACMVSTAYRIARFFEHESCGKCTPCREGTGWLRAVLGRVEDGKGKEGDMALLKDIAGNMEGKCFCALGESAAMSAVNFMENFRGEFDAHIREKQCVVGPASA